MHDNRYFQDMKKSPAFVCALLWLSMAFAACSLGLDTTGSSRVTHPDTELNLVDTSLPSTYSLGAARSGTTKSNSATSDRSRAINPIQGLHIILRAEVAHPTASDGTSLQASHIAIAPNGKKAYVAYMERGDAKFGALDVFDVSNPSVPVLASSELFPGGDIAALTLDGNTLYLVGSKDDPGGNAWVLALPLQGNGVMTAAYRERHLPGSFATDIQVASGRLYVTTATSAASKSAGLYVLEAGNLSTVTALDSSALDDLRSVVVDGDTIVVLSAQWPNDSATAVPKLRFYGSKLLASPMDQALTGFNLQAEAKSDMTVIDSYVFVACNLTGVAIFSTESHSLVSTIPPPNLDTAIVPRVNQSSNSLSSGKAGDKNLYFIANGEAGMWVGDRESVTAAGNGIVGSIRFGQGQSVNCVAGKNTTVVAAVGTGGLKIMEFTK